MTAEGRIVAVTYRITLSHARYSLYFTMGRKMNPQIAPSPEEIQAPTKYTVPWDHQSPQHLDWFSRFCRARGRDQEKDKSTDIKQLRRKIFPVKITDNASLSP